MNGESILDSIAVPRSVQLIYSMLRVRRYNLNKALQAVSVKKWENSVIDIFCFKFIIFFMNVYILKITQLNTYQDYVPLVPCSQFSNYLPGQKLPENLLLTLQSAGWGLV